MVIKRFTAKRRLIKKKKVATAWRGPNRDQNPWKRDYPPGSPQNPKPPAKWPIGKIPIPKWKTQPYPLIGGQTEKSFYQYGKVVKGHPKDHQLVKYNTNFTVRLVSGAIGKQGAQIVGTYWQPSEMNTLNAAFTNVPTQSQSVHYKGLQLGYRCVNMANTQATVRAYLIQYRYDATTLTDPYNDWLNGNSNEGGANYASNPDETPFSSKLFCQRYKVLKVFKNVVDAGARWDIEVGLNLNRTINLERLQNNLQIGGVTHAMMFVQYGGIENDSTTKTQISYAIPALDLIVSYRYEAHLPPLDNTILVNATNLVSAFTVAGEAINTDTSTIQTNIVA